MSRLLPLALLLGCAPGGETVTTPGTLTFCLGADGGLAEATIVDRYEVWTLAGTVVPTVDPAFTEGDCASDPEQVVSLDVGGVVHHFGWTATAEGDLPRTPALDDAVTLTFAHVLDWGNDRAVLVEDVDGILLAGEEGFQAELSEVADVGLEVSRSRPVFDLEDDGCGVREAESLTFTGDAPLELGVWVQGTLVVDGLELQARNVGAWSYVGDVGCTDTWGPMPWIVYR
jgi:hypothetical protein